MSLLFIFIIMRTPLRNKIYEIIFGTHTKAGKNFDLILLWTIILSVLVVMIESIKPLQIKYAELLRILEWAFTIIFSLEYLARIYSHPKPLKYIFSFWGVIDLLSIAPTYLSLIFKGAHFLVVIRLLRVLRVFRILKLGRYFTESLVLSQALKASSYKIIVFMLSVMLLVVIMGSVMYVVEGGQNGFSSIPQSIYWAVITITTVGYGDIVPVTVLGKFIASLMMLMGYSIIAVPTGIISVEIAKAAKNKITCKNCGEGMENEKANYCSNCGNKLMQSTPADSSI